MGLSLRAWGEDFHPVPPFWSPSLWASCRPQHLVSEGLVWASDSQGCVPERSGWQTQPIGLWLNSERLGKVSGDKRLILHVESYNARDRRWLPGWCYLVARVFCLVAYLLLSLNLYTGFYKHAQFLHQQSPLKTLDFSEAKHWKCKCKISN